MSQNLLTEQDELYMNAALEQAKTALKTDDVPVGAVIVCDGEIISTGCNTREKDATALGHAEMSAIARACDRLGTWRLERCTLYVTLEPCPMCAGAIMAARIPRVVYGTKDTVAGAMGSVWSLHTHPTKNDHTHVENGCLESQCREVLQSFFKEKRAKG
jgi:tRNA(adenine34) deaminase